MCGDPGYLETTFNVSQILSRKNGLGRATAGVHVLIGGRRVAVSKQVADAEQIARALGELGRNAMTEVVRAELRCTIRL